MNDASTQPAPGGRRWAVPALVALLLLVFAAQLAIQIAKDSSSWDEGDHIYAGLRMWKNGDYGLNPEHPPLIKLIATVPLLGMPVVVPEPNGRYFMHDAFLGGKELLFGGANDAEAILLRTRATIGLVAILNALVVFLVTRAMFGTGAGLVALVVLTFDPNIIAHGPRVATDTGVSLCFFATTYAFYRYVKAPSVAGMLLVGLGVGLTLATKHTGVFIAPMLGLLALAELVRGGVAGKEEPLGRRAAYLFGGLAASGLVGVLVLWATYGFRFAARPEGLALNPTFGEQIGMLKPGEHALLATIASWHLLPESYIYGLSVVRLAGVDYHSFALGTVYPHRVWFYFPLCFSIKTTLGLIGLLLLTLVAVATRRMRYGREVLFLTIPAALYFLVAMASGMNIGTRHILPVYVYLPALVGGAAWALARADRRWAYVAAALVVMHVGSSVKAFPTYMPYANEAWGGPSQTYRFLTDSSVDWAEQLKQIKRYCDAKGVTRGYFAYFAQGVLEPRWYGIPLEPLPTADSLWIGERIQVPPSIDGPVFISAGVLSGWEYGPGPLDPYAQFRDLKPTAVIDHAIFVFDGHFEIPLAAALGHAQSAGVLLGEGRNEEALAEAQAAVALAPDSVSTQAALGDALAAAGRRDEARTAWACALDLAKTVEPEFQAGWVPGLEAKLAPPT